MQQGPRYYWVICGFDGEKQFFQEIIAFGAMSEKEVVALLQRLATRDLTPLEIFSASLRKRAKRYVPLLEVHRESGSRITFSVGSNPHYVATAVPEGLLKDFEGLYS